MRKITLLLLLTLSVFGLQAQTTYQLNYDSIRVNKTAGTGGTSLYGKVYLKNVGLGLVSDSILTVKNGRIRKIPVSGVAPDSIYSKNPQPGITVVDLHHGILKGLGLLGNETPGTWTFSVDSTSNAGSTKISLSSNSSIVGSVALVIGQLIVYKGTDNYYYTARITSLHGSTLNLASPLEVSVASGVNVFNFYINESHPNAWGYYAIADQSINKSLQTFNIESRVDFNTQLGSGIVATEPSNSRYNTGSANTPANSVTSTTALTDGIQGTFLAGSTGSRMARFVINTLSNPVRVRWTYNGVNIDSTFTNSDPSIINIPVWVSGSGQSVVFQIASTVNGGQFILNESVPLLKVNGLSPELNSQKHVLFGDSWFAQYYLDLRIRERLPNAEIINAGVGGNTAQNLIDRFTPDVASESPDVVWLIVGTNDYYAGITNDVYSANINQLKQLTQSIGSHLVLFTSTVGSADSSASRFNLSRQYANLSKMYDEDLIVQGNSVPYTGADSPVDLGSQYLRTDNGINFNGVGSDGKISYNGSYGLISRGKTGSISDAGLFTPAGNVVWTNPTGTDDFTVASVLTAAEIVKSGGTSSQFLKADGSVSTGVKSITGTTNQVISSASSGDVILSLPQSINTSSSPSFSNITASTSVIGGTFENSKTGTGWLLKQASAANRGIYWDNSNGSWDFYNLGATGVRIKTTGEITSITASANDNSTKVATTAYVDTKSTSGTYTPTFTNNTNVTASTIVGTATYSKIGNIVHVSIAVTIQPTASSANTVLYFTLPGGIDQSATASNGIVSSNNFGYGVCQYQSATQGKAIFTSTGTTGEVFNIQYDYSL